MAEARFKFRLEALLEHRRTAEKDAQRGLAMAQQEVTRIMETIHDAQRRIAEENRALTTSQLTGILDMAAIGFGKRYVGNLHLKIALAGQKLGAAERNVATARAALLAAARARKVIDKLREKQEARWREERDRKEAAALDEIATQGFIRQYAAFDEAPIPEHKGAA